MADDTMTQFQKLILEKLDRVDEKCERLEDGHSEIKAILTGGSDPSHGVIVRLDRLEQSEVRRVWWQRAVAGVGLTSLAVAAKALFSNKGVDIP